ncbi:MAG: hypothetical protein HY985_01975 [Magnetospirillum sp.]|nr:hypothetical protein [Magnetospirillum sp.]
MTAPLRLAALAALVLSLPACARVEDIIQPRVDKVVGAVHNGAENAAFFVTGGRPGLKEAKADRKKRARDAALAAQGALPPFPAVAEDDSPSPFPAAAVPWPTAQQQLAGDPAALRFLALRQLAEERLIPNAEAAARRDANLGALLPLTAPLASPVGLEVPPPPVEEVVQRFRELGGPGPATPAERTWLLDRLLPMLPPARQPLSPPDAAAARQVLQRLNRLAEAGLISPVEQMKELAAVQSLLDSGLLPETLAPPPPPVVAPPKRKATRKVPSVAPPALPAAFGGPAGVHLLSMAAAGYGDIAWTALTKEHAELAGLTFKVSKADLGELGVTYRLIAGPLEPKAATALCAALKPRGQSCTPTPFPQ